MKKRILERFTDASKWKDYINLKSFECKIATIIALIFLGYAILTDMHGNFDSYVDVLKNLTIYIGQALIGVLGIIIAGVTIIFSLLNKKIVKEIEKVSKRSVQNLFISFEFLAFNVGIAIFLFFLVHVSLYSNLPLLNELIFYFIVLFLSYFLFFIIFYSISLISNIVRMFYIANIYDEIDSSDKNLYIIANEIRIDFMLKTLLSFTKVEKEEFLKKLDDYVDASDIQEKDVIKNYFRDYYDG